MYKKEQKSWMKHLDFTIIDIVVLQLAYTLSYWIRFQVEMPYGNEMYERLAIVLVMLDICVVFFYEPYKNILRRNNKQELKIVIVNSSIIFVGLLVYMYAIKQSMIYSRQLLFVYWGISIILEYIAHCALKIIIKKRMYHEKNLSVMIVVTTNSYAEECIREFAELPYREFIIKGVVIIDEQRQGEMISGIPVVANASDFFEYVGCNVVDEVFIKGNTIESSEALAEDLLEMGITVHFNLIHVSELRTNRLIEECGPYMVLTSSMRIITPRQLFLKRCMDIMGSLVGLVLMVIAFVIFAPIIKKQSPGPIFFTQIRVGKNGRKFKIYKFRSMDINAEERKQELLKFNEMDGLMFKMDDDPRIFPIGRIMRKFSVDELPQFWNILKGDMSLVGTRPPTEEEYKQYESRHCARLGIKSGLTGMWQVSGRSEITDFEEVVKLDTRYISNWTLGLDVKIILQTIKVVFTGKGAE